MMHNKIIRIAGTAAVTLAGVLCSGCGAGETGADVSSTLRIGVIVYDQYDTFISELMDCFSAEINEKIKETGRSVTLEVMDAAGSQSTQNEQVSLLIRKGCDVICVNLVDRTEPTTITDMAEKNGVPIVFFNRELVAEDLERWDQLYYVGADATQSGEIQGQIAARYFEAHEEADHNGDGICQYVILEGEAGHQDSIIRTEYSVNAMKEAGVNVEKLAYARANWNRAQAQTQTASLLDEYGDQIELILANNDDMALGAIDAMKAAGVDKDDWPAIIGIDGTSSGLSAVRRKEMIGTVYNDMKGQAEAMADLSCALAEGSEIDSQKLTDGKYIRLPYSEVTPENVNDY